MANIGARENEHRPCALTNDQVTLSMAALGSGVDSPGPFAWMETRSLMGILRRSRSAWPAAFVTTREITPQLLGPLRCPIDEGHERKSRVTLAARLAGKTAAETISVMLAVFARIEPALRKSITFDNDTAFAQHALLRTMRAMTTWFCDAYASWQKGQGRKRQRSITPLVASCPESAWAARPLSRRSSKSLAKTCKSGSHSPVALGRIPIRSPQIFFAGLTRNGGRRCPSRKRRAPPRGDGASYRDGWHRGWGA